MGHALEVSFKLNTGVLSCGYSQKLMGNSLISAARDGNLAKVKQIVVEKKTDVNYQDTEVFSAYDNFRMVLLMRSELMLSMESLRSWKHRTLVISTWCLTWST